MVCYVRLLFALFGWVAPAYAASGITATMNTGAAHAVLDALRNPTLSRESSLQIARLPGNQGIIRKLNEFRIPATTQSFADALYCSAHGVKAADATEQSFYFDDVKQKHAEIAALLRQIEGNPAAFQSAIEQRIASFSPPGARIHLQGYIVAGGDGGGYAFGDTDFYLNIGFGSELPVAKGAATHELYHAVQGAFAKEREAGQENADARIGQACQNAARLFNNLYEEGSATFVEDISLLSGAQTQQGLRMKEDMADGLKHVRSSASLLEMSILSLRAPNDPMSYHDVYEVGFYGHGILYNIGYVMAKAIVERDGPQGLAAFLKQPPSRFLLHYTELPKYGADADHPRLGPNTVAAANQIAHGCR